MTGNGHPHEPREGDRPDTRGRSARESTAPSQPDIDATHGSTAVGNQDGPGVDELEAQLHQKEATLQNVIDRYEAVLDEREHDDPGSHETKHRPDGFVDATREWVDDVLTDVKIAFHSRRR